LQIGTADWTQISEFPIERQVDDVNQQLALSHWQLKKPRERM
jgi:hypothetical protein